MRTVHKLIIASLFFSGCTEDPQPKEIEYVYVDTKVPKQTIFFKPKPYEITDFTSLGDSYIKVNAKQLKMASERSQRRIKVIWLYEKQAMKFNKEFAE